jgi:hypothetical protein
LQTLSRLDHLPPPPFQGDSLGFFLNGPLQSASPFDRSTGTATIIAERNVRPDRQSPTRLRQPIVVANDVTVIFGHSDQEESR